MSNGKSRLIYFDAFILQQIMIKKVIVSIIVLLSAVSFAYAQTGTWSGKLNVQGTQLSIVFHLDENSATFDSPDQGARGISAQLERGLAGKIIVRIPAIGASYEGQWMVNRIVGTFTQMKTSFPLTLTPGEDKPKRPQTPVGPFPYATEDVSFPNGNIVLNGTLVLPEGYSRNTPVLVMVTGSGQQNRDEEIFEHKPFAVIADALARAGVASLRYDDRGYGDPDAKPLEWTTDDFKSDALAGIAFLRERFDKAGVLGHSEGGTIAMMIAAEQKADFIVSLAGMAVSGAETLVSQNRTTLKEAGFHEETVDSYCKLISEVFHVRSNGGRMPNPDEYRIPESLKQNYHAMVAMIQTPYMIHFLSMDIRPLLGSITCPVLALNGTMDIQVDHISNLDAIRNGLAADSKCLIKSIEGVNHLFQHCSTGEVTEYRMIEETIAPEVLDEIIRWMSDFR